MATYTSNYGWTKPSGSDNVDISVLNNNLDDQDSTIHDAFLNMAPPFSESSTYAVDDIVLYGTTTYKCHTAVVTPGSWTGSTNWQVYKLSEGGGGGLTLGETSSTAYRGDRGKTAYDHSQTTGNPHGTTKSDVGLGNVPNVSTNDQTPTFTKASTRKNIASGEKLSVIFGKIQKFFNDLKSVAYSGSYNDLTNKPTIPDELADLTADSTHRVVTDAQISTWNGKSDFSGSYTDLTDKPKINSVELSGNKTTSDLGIDKTAVGLGNVPNVSTNDQTPTFTKASTRKNIASGEKLSVILGKVQKFFNDLKTVAFSGSFSDLSNKPSINSVELSGNKTSANFGLQNASTEITWADWILLTPQEQESGDWRITDCPWADGTVSIDLMTKLWENPSPTQAMASDTEISINDANYDLLAYVCFLKSTDNRIIPLVLTPKNKDAYVCYADSGNAIQRRFDYANGTITVKTGYIGSTIDNTCIILYQIYGIKTTASVKINAIASDVKASVDYSTSERLIGTWIDGSDLYEKTIDFGALPNTTTKNVSSGLNNITIRDIRGVAAASTGASMPLPYISDEVEYSISLVYLNGNVFIETFSDRSMFYGYVTLRYTKNS